MFARILRVDLKPGQGPAYADAIENKVIPILRKFTGFRDEFGLVSADGKEGIAISLWERQDDAEAFARTGFVEARKEIEPFMVGVPELHECFVNTSTAHRIAGNFTPTARAKAQKPE